MQIEIFPTQKIGKAAEPDDWDATQRAKIKRLGQVADRQVIQLYRGDRCETMITQGWRYKNLVVVPESDLWLPTWMLVHQPSGYPILAASMPHLLGFEKAHEICRQVESVRAIALLLSKVGISETLNKQKIEVLRELFKEAGIGDLN